MIRETIIRPQKGFPVVLTADRILMADYTVLLDGMMAAAQTTATPEAVMRSFLSPSMPCTGIRAKKAPLGLRRLEAALLRNGYSADQVAIVPPERLVHAIGPATRVVLISSGDPLGLGMNNSTMTAIVGGKPYTQVWFDRMMRSLTELRSRCPSLRVLLGGPGAWQAAQNGESLQRLGVDSVFCGYAEQDLARVISDLFDGKTVKPVSAASRSDGAVVPEILGPTSMGAVEISRGCGLGCAFCTLRSEPMVHMPVGRIVRDVETNVRAGVTSVSLISEDLLRYGSENGGPEPDGLMEMLRAVRAVKFLRLMQPDHVNVSSVVQFPENSLRQVRDIIARGVRHDYIWVNMGVESASGELLKANACTGKVLPFRTDEWKDVCEEAVLRLINAGFVPMVSLVFGLPGETEEHVRATLEFVERLRGKRVMLFPLFFAPVSSHHKGFGLRDMTPTHWRLFRLCYAFNFKWFPRTYWDNQRGAGVPLLRRLLMQLTGRINMVDWKLRFIWKSGRLVS